MAGHTDWAGPMMTRREMMRVVAGSCAAAATMQAMGGILRTESLFGPVEAYAAESADDLPQTITVTGESGVYRDAGVASQSGDGSPYMSAMKVVGSNVPVYCLATENNHSSPRPDEQIVFTKQEARTDTNAAVCGYILSYGYPAMQTVEDVSGQQARYVTQAALWMSDFTIGRGMSAPYWTRRNLDVYSASQRTRDLGLVSKARDFLNRAKAAVAAGWTGGVVLYVNNSNPGSTHSSDHWQQMVMGYTKPPKGWAKAHKVTTQSW